MLPAAGSASAAASAQGVATVEAAFAGGVRFFDTAPFYGYGRAERWLGAGLAGLPRTELTVSTKVGRAPVSADGVLRAEYDFSRDGVLRSLEESLGRLKLDAVDIVLIHDPDDYWTVALAEAYPALAGLRSQGVVGAIGVGMNQWQMLARFVAETTIDLVLLAGRYTLLDQSGSALLTQCRERGVAVVAGGVFNSGVLATDDPRGTYNYAPAPASVVSRARALATACARHGVSLPQAAMAFPARHPAVASVLVGAQSPAEIQQLMELHARPIPDALWPDLIF